MIYLIRFYQHSRGSTVYQLHNYNKKICISRIPMNL